MARSARKDFLALKPYLDSARETVESTLVTAILALFLISFVVQGFEIPSASMESTLLVGDRLLANKVGFAGRAGDGFGLLPHRDIERGDIIIFKFPEPPHVHYVKRVVGVPGDRLKIENRAVYINGELLDEPYKRHTRRFGPGDFRDNFPPGSSTRKLYRNPEWFPGIEEFIEGDELVIPEGKFFAMGDNRDNSQDSRYWGFVDQRNVVARPLVIYWSYRWFRRE